MLAGTTTTFNQKANRTTRAHPRFGATTVTQSTAPSHPPDRVVERVLFAQDWWQSDAFRLFPGEESDHTVYMIDFYDQCKYFGYTREPVFYRAASLAAHIASWGTNIFVEEHAARVPYAIRCIKSGLNDLKARWLRDMLVDQAPQNILHGRGSVVQTPKCWLPSHTELDPPLPAMQR